MGRRMWLLKRFSTTRFPIFFFFCFFFFTVATKLFFNYSWNHHENSEAYVTTPSPSSQWFNHLVKSQKTSFLGQNSILTPVNDTRMRISPNRYLIPSLNYYLYWNNLLLECVLVNLTAFGQFIRKQLFTSVRWSIFKLLFFLFLGWACRFRWKFSLIRNKKQPRKCQQNTSETKAQLATR